MWDTWTRVAALPVAFEPPSAGFVIDWAFLKALQARGVGFATLTHAAGISSTGDEALDARLPFDEAYHLPAATVRAISRTKAAGGRVVALGTTVTRALEHAASDGGALRPGAGLATQRIGPHTRLQIVDAIISGAHEPGESHYELLRAFADGAVLRRMSSTLQYYAYRSHEFGDSVLITRQRDKVLKGRRSSRRTRVWRGWGWRECGASGPGDLAAQHVLQHVDPPHTVERRRRLPHAVSSVSSLCARQLHCTTSARSPSRMR